MKSSRPPLLFIHGAWHGAWCWNTFFVPFFESKGYTCYSIDLPGHGEKSKGFKNSLGLASYMEVVDLEFQKIKKDVGEPILIAHSMGGWIVQRYMEKQAVKHVILLAPVPIDGVFKTSLTGLKEYPWVFTKAILSFNLSILVKNRALAKWAFFPDTISEEAFITYAEKLSNESYRAFLQMLRPNIKRNPNYKSTMLIVAGQEDRLFSPQRLRDTARFHEAEFIIQRDATHNLMLDPEWEQIALKMYSWLNRKGLS